MPRSSRGKLGYTVVPAVGSLACFGAANITPVAGSPRKEANLNEAPPGFGGQVGPAGLPKEEGGVPRGLGPNPTHTEAHRGHKSAHAFCKMKKQKSEMHFLYFKIHILKLVFFFISAVCEIAIHKT
jgi:hypothetical protein